MRRFTLSLFAMLPVIAGAAHAQSPAAPLASGSNSAFEAFGGESGIARIVDNGVNRLVNDDRIKARFATANIPRLKTLLTQQFCTLLGGGCVYQGRAMTDTHAGMELRNADFNALAEDFQFAMDDAGVPFRYQNVLLKQLAPMQHDVVTK